ncbi:Phage integrase [Gloeomargarita lithophora Alchichica-D10]|uniref:Phage integrase n=1 Tax=Gloeomargarita lithophora Alchichica-D10 TaxID=1188229 RepID=A0A1J0AFZ1_9CYAN|nr:integrase arm-type DNA-binding domain-containing protein [Gloeomargarita lithophora]APB34858.1 Phage integrase [Gloeomargarita lithophora Alchichica-D10]
MGKGLTDTAIRAIKAVEKLTRFWDSAGLYLEVTPAGGKRWRIKYYFGGKEKRLSLGCYPQITLKLARERRDEIRSKVAQGIDPSVERQAVKAALVAQESTLEVVAREWHLKHHPNWAESHSDTILRRLERDIFPWLGGRPIAEVTAPELLAVLRKVENRAPHTAHREFYVCSQIWRYAGATGRAQRDITYDLRGALAPVKRNHYPAVTNPQGVGQILRLIWNYSGSPVVCAALKIAPYIFVRPGELRTMQWADIDWQAREWRFTLSKTRQPHIVPLAVQVVAILRELEPITGRGDFVFPSGRGGGRPMSDGAILAALRTLGIPKAMMTGHSWRATARTVLDETLNFRVEWIEHQLGHSVRDSLGRAYNRTSFLPERRQMMQTWADYLDRLS